MHIKYKDFVLDSKQVTDKMKQLEPKQLKSATKYALNGGMRILKNQTVKNYKQLFKNKVNRYTKRQYIKGIQQTYDKKTETAKVHIMGDFILRMYEDGTDERYTKNGYYRGRITGRHYFRDAQKQSKDKVMAEVEKRLGYKIMQIADK